jgi:hypothetical protein
MFRQIRQEVATIGNKPNEKNNEPDRTLWGLNLGMGILHVVIGLCILIISVTKGAPFLVKFQSFWSSVDLNELPDALTNSTCNGTKHTDVFEWFGCLRDSSNNAGEIVNDENRAQIYQIKANDIASIKVWILLFAFEMVTAAFHIGLVIYHKTYVWFVNNEMQPFRWIEYSFTSSVMLLCIMALSRISDAYALFGFFFCSIFIELCGGLCFELFTFLLKETRDNTGRVDSVIWHLRWVFYVLSVICFVVSYVAVFDAFYTIIEPYFQLPNATLWEQLFGFIKILNFCLLGAYCLFPMIHVSVFTGIVHYRTGEICYLVASLVAKAILTITIFIACLQRND